MPFLEFDITAQSQVLVELFFKHLARGGAGAEYDASRRPS